MKIILANDHGGYHMKKELAANLAAMGHEIIDIGAHSEASVHYPVLGREAAERLAAGEADRAILICGTGIGMCLAANTVRGVRCINCTEPYTALLSRRHNDANALALGARVVGIELAMMIIETWLAAEFEGGRHATRVDMLTAMKAAASAYAAPDAL